MPTRVLVSLVMSAALLVGGCSSEGSPSEATPSSSTVLPTSTIAPTTTVPTTTAFAGATLPDGSPPRDGLAACTSEHLTVQSASFVPVGDAPGLFVRILNTGRACWLDGHPKVSLRDEAGNWRDFTYDAVAGSTTNGPEWTGVFDPSLVGVVVFGERAPRQATPTSYDALRLTLPNGGGVLELDGVRTSTTADVLTVYPFEADSQDF